MNENLQSEGKNGNTTIYLQSPNPSPLSSVPRELYEMTQTRPSNNNASASNIQQSIHLEVEHVNNSRFSTNHSSQNGSKDINIRKHSIQMKEMKIYTLSNGKSVRWSVRDIDVEKDFNSI